MLDIKMLKAMPPQTLFACGITVDGPEGINMTESGNMLRWVAVRGGIWDWSIYVGLAINTNEDIKRFGDKVYAYSTIRRLVPCDDEAFAMYRL